MTMDESNQMLICILFVLGFFLIMLGINVGHDMVIFLIIGICMIVLCSIIIIVDVIETRRKKSMVPNREASRSLSSQKDSRTFKKNGFGARPASSEPPKKKSTPAPAITYTCRICRKTVSKAPYLCDYCGLPYCSKHRLHQTHNCWAAPKDSESGTQYKGKHKASKSKDRPIISRKCTKCDIELSWPYVCKRCGKQFCSIHRLPESHYCEQIHNIRKTPLNRPKSTECNYCGNKSVFTFYCELCGNSFCSPHRLPEDHHCEKIQTIRRVELKGTTKNYCIICEQEISASFTCQYCHKQFCYEHISLQIHSCPKAQSSPKKLLPTYVTEKTEYPRFCLNCGMLIKAGAQCEVCTATGVEESEMHEIEKWVRRGLDKRQIYG